MFIKIIKKYVSIHIVTALLLLISIASAQTQNVIRINNIADLQKIGTSSDFPSNGFYELTGNIDASSTRDGAGFAPVGTASAPFTGSFNGNGRTISNLRINRPSSGSVGLFGVIGESGIVRSVVIDRAEIIGSHSVGTVAGLNYGTIERCFVNGGSVRASRQESNAGGLVGVNGGVVNRSYSEAVVDGKDNVGGLAGFLTIASRGVISQSYAVGGVTGTGRVGGLVGRVFGGTLSDCYAAGRVTAAGKGAVGGLIGDDFVLSAPSSVTWGKDNNGNYITKAVINRSYWDRDASGQNASAGGTPKTTSDMRRHATFDGWNFLDVWSISEGVSYPRLQFGLGGGSGPGIIDRNSWLVTYEAKTGGYLQLNGISNPVHLYIDPAVPRDTYGPRVTAVADDGWRFVKWSDGSTDPERTDFVSRDITLYAEFEVRP